MFARVPVGFSPTWATCPGQRRVRFQRAGPARRRAMEVPYAQAVLGDQASRGTRSQSPPSTGVAADIQHQGITCATGLSRGNGAAGSRLRVCAAVCFCLHPWRSGGLTEVFALRRDRVRLDTGVRSRIRGAPTSPPALAADERAEHREGRTDHDGPCVLVHRGPERCRSRTREPGTRRRVRRYRAADTESYTLITPSIRISPGFEGV